MAALVVEAEHGVEPHGVERDGPVLGEQRVGEGEHGVYGVFGRAAVAPGKVEIAPVLAGDRLLCFCGFRGFGRLEHGAEMPEVNARGGSPRCRAGIRAHRMPRLFRRGA